MAFGPNLAQGKEQVQRADNVVHLRADCVLAVDHRIGRGALFSEVNHRLRLEFLDRGGKKVIIGNIADKQLHRLAGELLPCPQPFGKGANRGQSLDSQFVVP